MHRERRNEFELTGLRKTLNRKRCSKYILGKESSITMIEKYESADHILRILRDFSKLQLQTCEGQAGETTGKADRS